MRVQCTLAVTFTSESSISIHRYFSSCLIACLCFNYYVSHSYYIVFFSFFFFIKYEHKPNMVNTVELT